MDARSARFGPWLGGAILLGLVTLMVVVASVRGTVVAGSPLAAPVPGPPEPGHCLLENPSEDPGYFGSIDSGAGALPSLRTGPCTGGRYGEVVSVGPGIDLADSLDHLPWEQCWREAYEYLGLPDPAPPDGRRSVDVNVLTGLVGPDERQLAAGQDWAACLVQPAPFTTDDAPAVGHSFRDAWSRAEDRRLLAVCLHDDQLTFAGGCGEPHGAEQLSTWRGDAAGSGQSDVDACRVEAVAALGSPAALDRGDLEFLALPTRWTDAGGGQQLVGPDAVSGEQPYYVVCLLVPADPTRQLIGPLRDLGDAPVPLR